MSENKLPWADGVTAAERDEVLPCNALVPHAGLVLDRGVDVRATAGTTWRWLCQLRAAPYSYDWIDNLGRRSPRSLTPGLDRLEAGQRVAAVFRLVSWAEGDHLTVAAPANPAVGATAATWAVRATGTGDCRLLMRMVGDLGPVRSTLLAWGDLPMARKQLRTIAALAEGTL